MGNQRKIKAEIKRIQMARDLNEQLLAFHDEELKQNEPDDAWQKAIMRLDRHVAHMISKHPQEQNVIIQAVRRLEYAYEKARQNQSTAKAQYTP